MSLNADGFGSMNNPAKIIRPLGKMERSMWFCDQSSPTNIGLGCEIHGCFTDEALRMAFKFCQIRHPILRSVVQNRDNNIYFACHETSHAPEIPLEICVGAIEDENRVVVEEMQKPLNGTQGLLIRAKLIRINQHHSFIVIVFSHVIGDGFSAVLLLQDTINYLGNLTRREVIPDPVPLPFPPPSEQGIPQEHRGWSGLKKLFAVQKEVAEKLKAWGSKPSPVLTRDTPCSSPRKMNCKSFNLTEAETRAFVARSKQEKVSVFALLGGCLLDAFQPSLEPSIQKNGSCGKVMSFAAPVDMRPFLKSSVKEHFGFYSSAVNHLCLLQESNDPVMLAKQLHADLLKSFIQKKVHLHTTPLLAAFLAWRWLFPLTNKGIRRVAKLTEGMFKSCATSLTFLNDSIVIEKHHGITISNPRGHISPSIMGVALYCVLLYNDTLSAHVTYNSDQLSEDDVAALNDRFKRNILKSRAF